VKASEHVCDETCQPVAVDDPQWVADCMKWHGRVLTGRLRHWCFDWDELPIDETCENEITCCTDL
jgi:hypothetical protein